MPDEENPVPFIIIANVVDPLAACQREVAAVLPFELIKCATTFPLVALEISKIFEGERPMPKLVVNCGLVLNTTFPVPVVAFQAVAPVPSLERTRSPEACAAGHVMV